MKQIFRRSIGVMAWLKGTRNDLAHGCTKLREWTILICLAWQCVCFSFDWFLYLLLLGTGSYIRLTYPMHFCMENQRKESWLHNPLIFMIVRSLITFFFSTNLCMFCANRLTCGFNDCAKFCGQLSSKNHQLILLCSCLDQIQRHCDDIVVS